MIELRFQNFFAARNKIVHRSRAIFGPFEKTLKSKKIRKNRFFQNESGFDPDNDKWKDATW